MINIKYIAVFLALISFCSDCLCQIESAKKWDLDVDKSQVAIEYLIKLKDYDSLVDFAEQNMVLPLKIRAVSELSKQSNQAITIRLLNFLEKQNARIYFGNSESYLSKEKLKIALARSVSIHLQMEMPSDMVMPKWGKTETGELDLKIPSDEESILKFKKFIEQAKIKAGIAENLTPTPQAERPSKRPEQALGDDASDSSSHVVKSNKQNSSAGETMSKKNDATFIWIIAGAISLLTSIAFLVLKKRKTA